MVPKAVSSAFNMAAQRRRCQTADHLSPKICEILINSKMERAHDWKFYGHVMCCVSDLLTAVL